MRCLVTGGSANGKSTFAESFALSLPGPHCYLATMRPMGKPDQLRIERHRALRAGKGFVTVERYTNLSGLSLPEPGGTVLVECLCNLVANEMFDPSRSCDTLADAFDDCRDDYPPEVDALAADAVLSGIEALSRRCENLILVTNDVGADGGGYASSTMAYVHTLGFLNAALAAKADCVYELVAGIPLVLKGDPA